jgi:hypothetical protein
VKPEPLQREGEPWRAESPRELRAARRSKPPAYLWRTLAWSKPLKTRTLPGPFHCSWFGGLRVGVPGVGGWIVGFRVGGSVVTLGGPSSASVGGAGRWIHF